MRTNDASPENSGAGSKTTDLPSPERCAVPFAAETTRNVKASPSGSTTNVETGTTVSRSTCVNPEPTPITGGLFGEKPRFA